MVCITVSRAICTVCTKNANGLYKRIYQQRLCVCIRVYGLPPPPSSPPKRKKSNESYTTKTTVIAAARESLEIHQ